MLLMFKCWLELFVLVFFLICLRIFNTLNISKNNNISNNTNINNLNLNSSNKNYIFNSNSINKKFILRITLFIIIILVSGMQSAFFTNFKRLIFITNNISNLNIGLIEIIRASCELFFYFLLVKFYKNFDEFFLFFLCSVFSFLRPVLFLLFNNYDNKNSKQSVIFLCYLMEIFKSIFSALANVSFPLLYFILVNKSWKVFFSGVCNGLYSGLGNVFIITNYLIMCDKKNGDEVENYKKLLKVVAMVCFVSVFLCGVFYLIRTKKKNN